MEHDVPPAACRCCGAHRGPIRRWLHPGSAPGSTGSPDGTNPALTTIPAVTTTVPDLRPPGEMSDAEWATWVLPRLVGSTAVVDAEFTVNDVVGLLEGGRTRLGVALDLTNVTAMSTTSSRSR